MKANIISFTVGEPTVVCDESNNPPEVIAKNEMVITTTFPLKATLYEIIITEDNK